MNEYRVTRRDLYGPRTPGFSNPSARQGYYVDANSPEDARKEVRARLKLSAAETLDVSLWKTPEGYEGSHQLL